MPPKSPLTTISGRQSGPAFGGGGNCNAHIPKYPFGPTPAAAGEGAQEDAEQQVLGPAGVPPPSLAAVQETAGVAGRRAQRLQV